MSRRGFDRRTAITGLMAVGAGTVLAGCSRADDAAVPAAASASAHPEPLTTDGRTLLSAGPGKKWDVEGNALRFTGNTFVAPVPQNSAFFRAQRQALRMVGESRFRRHFGLLPANSMHMTVFEGVNQSWVGTPDWPQWLAGKDMQGAHLAVLDAVTRSGITAPRPVTMRVSGWNMALPKGFVIGLTSIDDATERSLRDFRNRMEEILRLSPPKGFAEYKFHSSLGYRLVEPLPDEVPELDDLGARILGLFTGEASTVTLDPVAMNIFDDMLAFPQIKIL